MSIPARLVLLFLAAVSGGFFALTDACAAPLRVSYGATTPER
jgi:hypothetical protein